MLQHGRMIANRQKKVHGLWQDAGYKVESRSSLWLRLKKRQIRQMQQRSGNLFGMFLKDRTRWC